MPPVPATPSGKPSHFVAWLVGERILRAALSAIVLAAVARHLGPAGFGTLNLALTLVGLAMPLAQLAAESVVVRELVRRPAEAGALLGSAAALRFGTGVLCVAAVQIAALLPGLAPARGALTAISVLLLIQATEVTDLWFRRHVQSRTAVFARTTAVLASAALKLGLVAAGAGVVAFAWVQVIEGALFSAVLAFAYTRRGGGPRWHWNTARLRELWRESRFFALGLFLTGLALRVDQLAVSWWLGAEAGGNYFAALRLIELPVFVATAVAASLFPAVAGAPTEPQWRRVFAAMSALGWLVAVGGSACAPWLVPLLFGPAYADATRAFVLHAWACLHFFLGLARTQFLVVQHAAGTQLAVSGATLALQIALNATLIPALGVPGAALAYLITQFAVMWILPFCLPQLQPCLAWQWQAVRAAWRADFWRAAATDWRLGRHATLNSPSGPEKSPG